MQMTCPVVRSKNISLLPGSTMGILFFNKGGKGARGGKTGEKHARQHVVAAIVGVGVVSVKR